MFKSIFSFDGRIRRKEYGLSFLIYTVITGLLWTLMINTVSHYNSNQDSTLLLLFLFIPCFIFMLAQATKRCHDLGNSGWYQFIPFYFLWLLFADGQWGHNLYGPNPKGIGNVEFSFETEHQDNE